MLFNENCSKGSENMEWTQNCRIEPMAFKCDLDFEFVFLNIGMKINENISKGIGDMEQTPN